MTAFSQWLTPTVVVTTIPILPIATNGAVTFATLMAWYAQPPSSREEIEARATRDLQARQRQQMQMQMNTCFTLFADNREPTHVYAQQPLSYPETYHPQRQPRAETAAEAWPLPRNQATRPKQLSASVYSGDSNGNSTTEQEQEQEQEQERERATRGVVMSVVADSAAPINTQCDRNYVSSSVGQHLRVRVEFIKHLTLAERRAYPTNTKLAKTWRLMNCGRAMRGNDVEFVRFKFKDNLPMAGTEKLRIPNVMPGEKIDITVSVITAAEPGRRCAYYRLRKGGVYFGCRCWCDVTASHN